MSKAVSSLEELVEQLGNPGRFQFIMLLVLYTMEIPVAWATMLMSFAGKVPDWWCEDDGGGNVTDTCLLSSNTTLKQCPSMDNQCDMMCFDPDMRTVVSEWSLVCDKSAITATVTSIQMAGNLIGAIVSGQVADAFGRKKALYLDLLILTIACSLAGFATSWEMYSVCTFFIGIACGGYLVTYFPLAVEFVTTRWRTVVGCFPFWSLGFAIFGLIAWPIHDFKHLSLLIACITAPFLFTYRYFPESIRWQMTNGKLDEATETIARIARFNKIRMPDLSNLKELAEEEDNKRKLFKKYTYLNLYNSRTKLKKAFVFHFMWCISSIVYYGLSFGARNLIGHIYLNITLSGLAELPRIPVVIYLNDKIGRRWTCFCFYLLCSLCCFTVAICAALDVSGFDTIHFAMALAGKMTITAGWAAMKVYTAEHYPTVVRTLGTGANNIAAGVGSIIAPYFVFVSEKDLMLPNAVIGGLVLVNTALPFLLQETFRKPLPDIYQEEHGGLTEDTSEDIA